MMVSSDNYPCYQRSYVDVIWVIVFCTASPLERVSCCFPHYIIQRREASPLGLAFIFVAMARRMGLKALPLALPLAGNNGAASQRLYIHVACPDPAAPSVLFTLNAQLDRYTLVNAEWMCTIFHLLSMFALSLSNVVENLDSVANDLLHTPTSVASFYLVKLGTMLLRRSDLDFRPRVTQIGTNTLDFLAVVRDGIAPFYNSPLREELTRNLQTQASTIATLNRQIQLREGTGASWFVGMIVQWSDKDATLPIGCICSWKASLPGKILF